MSYSLPPPDEQKLPEFTIWNDGRGRWLAHEAGGLVGGWFVRRKEAVRFALHEATGDPQRVHVVPKSAGLRH